MTKPTRLEVCCCGACETEGHPKEQIIELTDKEIADMQAAAEAFAAEEAARKAEEDAKAAAKASAKAKLAALGLTDEEIAALG